MKQISGIYIYPVKSLGHIALSESAAGLHGLSFDRQWMVVDRQGMFVTQRKVPQMALVRPQMAEGRLILSHQEAPGQEVSTPLSGPRGVQAIPVQVWGDKVEALPCSAEVNEWLSDQLGVFSQLVYLPREHARPLSERYGRSGEKTLFSDSCPLLVVGEASLQDLNSQLADPVPMTRFRPNLVFSGGTAYEEDGWKQFRIGPTAYRGIRKCTRCKMINTDQSTARVYQEPLATLARYRRDAQGIYFGLHASLALGQADVVIRVGDEVKAI